MVILKLLLDNNGRLAYCIALYLAAFMKQVVIDNKNDVQF